MIDDTLIFYYYGDGLDNDERREVALALGSDPQLAERYARLCGELDALANIASEPAPAHLAARWHDAIDHAAQQEAASNLAGPRRTRWSGLEALFWGGALTATLALGIAIGEYMGEEEAPNTMSGTTLVSAGNNAPTSMATFSRGLLVHFQDSRRQLAALSPESNGERNKLILELVAQNRLFERAAEQSDAQGLARVLRAFEPVLLRLVAEDLSAQEMTTLQAQLGFELNIMLTKLTRELSDKSDTFDT